MALEAESRGMEGWPHSNTYLLCAQASSRWFETLSYQGLTVIFHISLQYYRCRKHVGTEFRPTHTHLQELNQHRQGRLVWRARWPWRGQECHAWTYVYLSPLHLAGDKAHRQPAWVAIPTPPPTAADLAQVTSLPCRGTSFITVGSVRGVSVGGI